MDLYVLTVNKAAVKDTVSHRVFLGPRDVAQQLHDAALIAPQFRTCSRSWGGWGMTSRALLGRPAMLMTQKPSSFVRLINMVYFRDKRLKQT